MGKETQLLEAAAQGNYQKVEVGIYQRVNIIVVTEVCS